MMNVLAHGPLYCQWSLHGGELTVGANDSWQNSVGCQGGGNHPDVWYTFTATGSQANLPLLPQAPGQEM
jgi:hypothetical protein